MGGGNGNSTWEDAGKRSAGCVEMCIRQAIRHAWMRFSSFLFGGAFGRRVLQRRWDIRSVFFLGSLFSGLRLEWRLANGTCALSPLSRMSVGLGQLEVVAISSAGDLKAVSPRWI